MPGATSPPPIGESRAAEPRPPLVGGGESYASRRLIGRLIATGLLLVSAGNALQQALSEASDILNRTNEPLPKLLAFQSIIALLATAAAIGVWKRTRWSAKMTIAWGIVSATFVALLEFLLDLGADARGGLLTGAALILALAAAIARFAQRDRHIAEADIHVDALTSPAPSSQSAARDVISDRQRH